MKIISDLYLNFSPKIRKQLTSLTLRETVNSGSSLMLEYIRIYKNPMCFVALEQPDYVLGWLLLRYPNTEDQLAMVYVRRSRRREGVGTKLIRASITEFGQSQYDKWSEEAAQFFYSLEVNK